MGGHRRERPVALRSFHGRTAQQVDTVHRQRRSGPMKTSMLSRLTRKTAFGWARSIMVFRSGMAKSGRTMAFWMGLWASASLTSSVCPTDGDVWIATKRRADTLLAAKGQLEPHHARRWFAPPEPVQAIAFDKEGNIVLGTQCDGVALANAADGYKNLAGGAGGREKMPLTATGQGLPTNLINDVLVARDGTIYAATTTGLAWSGDGGANWSYMRGEDLRSQSAGLTRRRSCELEAADERGFSRRLRLLFGRR